MFGLPEIKTCLSEMDVLGQNRVECNRLPIVNDGKTRVKEVYYSIVTHFFIFADSTVNYESLLLLRFSVDCPVSASVSSSFYLPFAAGYPPLYPPTSFLSTRISLQCCFWRNSNSFICVTCLPNHLSLEDFILASLQLDVYKFNKFLHYHFVPNFLCHRLLIILWNIFLSKNTPLTSSIEFTVNFINVSWTPINKNYIN